MGVLLICCSEDQLEKEGSGDDEEMSVYELTPSMTLPLKSSIRVPSDSVRWMQKLDGTSRSYVNSSGTFAGM